MPTSQRPATPQLIPMRKKSSSKTIWVVILLLAGGGGAYYWHTEQQAEQARLKLEEQKARRKAAEEAAEKEYLMTGRSLSSRKSAMARSMDKLKRTVGTHRVAKRPHTHLPACQTSKREPPDESGSPKRKTKY